MSSIHRIWNVTRLFFSAALAVAALWLVAQTNSPSAVAVLVDVIHMPSGPISDVTIFDRGYSPDVITITAVSNVRWTYATGALIHTTTSDTGSTEVWTSGILSPGQMFTHTFNTPGAYGYYCQVHGAAIMHGFVIVLPVQSPTSVSVDGPSIGVDSLPYTFTATVSPITTTLPITYVWQISSQSPVTHSGGLTDTLALSWTTDMTGTQWITATAINDEGNANNSLLILIDPLQVYLPLIMK